MNPLIQCKTTILPLLIAGVLAGFGLLPKADAVVPAPDGGYPNFTTAAGDHALQALTSGVGNTAIGTFSLFSVTTGSFNTAVGAGALDLNTADSNTATGAAALLFNTTGTENTANGTAALEFNETGSNNTASGAFALFSNTTGVANTASGGRALFSNTEGSFNTASGFAALHDNTTGATNTAIGDSALYHNDTGNLNTALGQTALFNNTIGNENTATGAGALQTNLGGGFNTANGFNALAFNTNGIQNTAMGDNALLNNESGSGNTAVGYNALAASGGNGSGNIALGANAGGSVTTASNVTCIGATGENVGDSCFIGRIYSNVQPIVGIDPDSVTITSAGRLGRGGVSSRRYKHDITPMDKASEVLYALKPVSFRYHKEYDATQTLAFGLIAEEVAEVYPDLVGRNPNGQPESVRYDQVNAMLLNEFLKEHRKVQELEASVAQQHKDFDAAVAELKGQIQKVSAQLELSKAEPQTVLNNQ
jgi:trimeric autotransporter adhesin